MPLPLPSVRSNSLTRLVRANPAAVEKIPSREMKAITRGSKISCTSFGTSISTPANEAVESEHTIEVWAAIAVRSSTTKRSEEHTSELQSLMRISYAVFCLKKKKYTTAKKNVRYCHSLNTQ